MSARLDAQADLLAIISEAALLDVTGDILELDRKYHLPPSQVSVSSSKERAANIKALAERVYAALTIKAEQVAA